MSLPTDRAVRTVCRALMLASLLGACSSSEPAAPDAGAGLDAVAGDSLVADARAADAAPDAAQDPRPALRARSLFANLDFEQADATGAPASWQCSFFGEGAAPATLCSVAEGGAVHGKRKLVVAPQVAVYQDAQGYGAGHLRFELFARRDGGAVATDAYAFGFAGDKDVRLQLYGRGLDPAADGWSLLWSPSADVAGTDRLRLVIFNSSATAQLEIDDGIAVLDAQPTLVPGHLLRAEHQTGLICGKGAEPMLIWIPLPLDHGLQVPLHVALQIDPPQVAQQIAVSYSVDEHGNLGALLEVAPGAAFASALVRWSGVVLAREAEEAELPQLYAATAPVEPWLAPTAIVQSDHAPLKSAVEQVIAGASTPLDKLRAILGWTSGYVTNQTPLQSLDAKSVFESKNASCTGYANLAAAAGRIAGLPTRTIANYLVGMAQQTHSINEFYLGPDQGWRLVEPQGTATRLPADYAVVVHVDTPADEGPDAMSFATAWAIPGVPLRSLVTPLAGFGRCATIWGVGQPFADCPGPDQTSCDNRAAYQAALRSSVADVRDAFDRARSAWQKTLARFTSTAGPDAAEQALRAAFLESTDLASVQTALTKVEAQQAP